MSNAVLKFIPAFEPAASPSFPLATATPGTNPYATSPDPLVPTVFHERWWLDIATEGRYEEVQVHEHGRLVGRLPYAVTTRHRLLRVSVMPDLTHALGPAVDVGSGSSNTRWLRRLDITAELAARLPPLSLFTQVCHPETPELFGFQQAGFEALLQFSAEIEPAPEDLLWRAMRDKTRNVIRRAAERQRVETLDDPEEFARFYADNLGTRGDASYFDLGLIAPLYQAAARRHQARILCARNENGRMVAAVFYLWDRQRMWYFLSSRSRAHPDNGAVSLLLWQGIQDAARRGLIFDFDGIAGSGSARFFAGFGARVVPRYAVRRRSQFYTAVKAVVDAVRGTRRNHFAVS